MELDHATPLTKLPPIIAKPTYGSPSKNLRATRYITTKLAGLLGEELREKQARLQELLITADQQQEAMKPAEEASDSRSDPDPLAVGQDKSHAHQASSPNQGQAEHSRSNRAPGKTGRNHHAQQSCCHNQPPHD
jgi:hypothetical protein